MSQEALLLDESSRNPVAWWQGRTISRGRFQAHVRQVCEALPDRRHAILLCEDRYRFLVAFAACLLRRQVILLPPSRMDSDVRRLERDYPDSHRLDDAGLARLDPDTPGVSEQAWRIPLDRLAVQVFTSGSTGVPRANPKRWGELVAGARRVRRQFGLQAGPARQLVATVPPQHMFGLEMSIMLPLQTGITVHAGKPFFPQDVLDALEALPGPRILVTTPLHLKAMTDSALDWPALDFVLSATAPLSPDLARRVEQACGAPVREIFGCSEAGAVAARETVRDAAWTLLDGYRLEAGEDGHYLHAGEDGPGIRLPDRIRCLDARHFVVLGRDSDMVNIAGKRGSLGDLTRRLRAIPGVEDGVFLQPDRTDGEREPRLAALVVAPGMRARDILAALAREIDEVFLPRPLRLVERLPYNETGKLPRASLLAMLEGRAVSDAPVTAVRVRQHG